MQTLTRESERARKKRETHKIYMGYVCDYANNQSFSSLTLSVSCPFYTDLSDRTLKQTEKKREQQQQQNKYTILFESQYISFYFLAFNQTDLSPSTI